MQKVRLCRPNGPQRDGPRDAELCCAAKGYAAPPVSNPSTLALAPRVAFAFARVHILNYMLSEQAVDAISCSLLSAYNY
jgi:hypothetical protein